MEAGFVFGLLAVALVLAWAVYKRQESPKNNPKRKFLVHTMLKYRAARKTNYGPFHCKRTIELDYIPQIGMQMEVEPAFQVQQVAMVSDEGGVFRLILTKAKSIDFDVSDDSDFTEDDFVEWLEKQGWDVTRPDKDTLDMEEIEWKRWPEYKSWMKPAS